MGNRYDLPEVTLAIRSIRSEWTEAFLARGARHDEWRFREPLPPIVSKLDRAARLDHSELTGRSLWLSGRRG